METQQILIVVTGPESSGKTTLAKQLALHLNAYQVEEFSRAYLTDLCRPYTEQDVLKIGLGQHESEQAAVQSGAETVVCDTDLTVIKVWSEVRYGTAPAIINELLIKASPRFYLLMRPDLPWMPDPLRENPDDRKKLFERYVTLLQEMGADFSVIDGTEDLRLDNALNALKARSRVMPQTGAGDGQDACK